MKPGTMSTVYDAITCQSESLVPFSLDDCVDVVTIRILDLIEYQQGSFSCL